MIREIISPKTNQITINIPANMVNQELELLVFPVGKKQAEKEKTKLIVEKVFNKDAPSTQPFLGTLPGVGKTVGDLL